jgi:hypothetical protein
MMKFLTAMAVAAMTATAAHATAYLPVGPQTNVAVSTVTGGGWVQCYSAAYGDGGTPITTALAGCTGTKLMLAGRATGSDTLLLLAEADTADVLFDTGVNTDVVHLANGSNWYFNDDLSWGFADASQAVYKSSCDASGVFNDDTANGQLRLCWHTSGGLMEGGFRLGNNVFINDSTDFEKIIYTNTGTVPEPESWALMLAGFAMIGVTLRRRIAIA